MRIGRGLRRLSPGPWRSGPWAAFRRQRELERCAILCGVAFARDGQAYRLLVESDLEAIWHRWPYDLEWHIDRWRYDLEWNHGEWVRACPITGIDIHGDNCFVRVIRGGIREGGNPKNRLRYSDRFDSDVRFADIGFRVIIDPASHYRGMER